MKKSQGSWEFKNVDKEIKNNNSCRSDNQILKIPIVDKYKYMGIILSHNITQKENKPNLKQIIKDYKNFMNKLKPSIIPIHIKVNIW